MSLQPFKPVQPVGTVQILSEILDHEGTPYPVPVRLSEEDRAARAEEDAQLSMFATEDSAAWMSSLSHFLDELKQGKTPDVALCQLIRDQMVGQLTRKVDQLSFLSQLRVRDHYTYSHTLHVAALSVALGLRMGYDPAVVREIGLASILHDLGKLLIPKSIMFKASRLTEKEFSVMKLHPGLGYNIIRKQLQLPEEIGLPALEHQEMWGGGGYPQNLVGEAIHPYSQIVKVADVYDALTARRPYKDALPSSKAMSIMLSEGEKSFNPKLLDVFVDMSNHPVEAAVG